MLSPLDTRITFFGGAFNIAALEAVVRLADAGYTVVAGSHDPRESVVFQNAAIPMIRDRFDAIAGSQVILTSCLHPEDVEELYLGDNGLLELAEPGTILLDLSFTTPRLAREIQAMAAIQELDFLDAPVVNMGEQEQGVCFIGGEPNAVESIAPLLPFLAPSVHPLDGPGSGQFSAMIAYIGLACSIMGAIEAMGLARIGGFSETCALNALAATNGASRALIEYAPRIMRHDFSGKLKVGELLDALDLALETAESMELTIPMIETAYQLCDLLSVVGGDDMSIQALSLLYEDEQTCADYGLDWALADRVQEDGYGMDGMPQEGDYGDVYGEGGLFNRLTGGGRPHGMPGTPGMPGGRGGIGGNDGPDGSQLPPASSFFSPN